MRGTKEKNDMLKAVPQTEQQDGVTFVRSCEKRFRLLSSTKDTVTGDMRRRAIEECGSLFRIKLFRDRVNGNLRAQFPAGKGDLEWKDLKNIVRVQDTIKDEVEEWSMPIGQDLLRRQSCPYSVYELKKFGIDYLNAVVTAIRAAEAKKITAKEKPSEAKQPSSPEGGGTGEPSQKQVKYQKRMASLAEAKGRGPGALALVGTGRCPDDYAVTQINSARPEVRQNAQMRNYNVKHRFPRNLFGITTKEWSTMTDEQKGLVSANVADQQPDMNKQFAALAKEIKHKFAQDMDDTYQVQGEQLLSLSKRKIAWTTEGDELPELTGGDDSDSEDGFLDQEDREIAEHRLRKLGESKPEAEAAFCDDKLCTRSSLAELLPSCMSALLPCCFGVVPSRNGCQDGAAGTISMEGYEKLKNVTGQALNGEQRQRMNQVQPVCKLRNDSLEQGMALIAAGGEQVLSPAILMDSGANCNTIPPRMVKKLGLKVMTMDVEGSHAARCDGTSAQFREYAYVDAIVAAGTPSATLHRTHVFVMEADSN
ncbi:hypothetical protein CYMTET_45107 [Cymbomonas tetramitiformis]|uniref:Uncharacterized protein n=1 Tax=Cymbomonas tetramitiformis TaxID=36881 RepID=A0AAE0EYW8_9CHLO|nr:hypothetical protein CYMTET_45111 [Cymbomonas tetramitiformis]KAK3245318.1 hypothetical protein CYMTET_45107 [Cymbomonas tetramitiformis]